jgi:hypothetical protein
MEGMSLFKSKLAKSKETPDIHKRPFRFQPQFGGILVPNLRI